MTEADDQVTLAELRKRAELTRRQVAIALGVTEKTIYVWEMGANEPRMTPAQTKQLMETLQCSFEELVIATKKRSPE